MNWIRRLFCRTKNKETVADPPRCICGGLYVPTAFMAPNVKGEMVEYHGLCCATKGCAGNFAERWATEIERIVRQPQ